MTSDLKDRLISPPHVFLPIFGAQNPSKCYPAESPNYIWITITYANVEKSKILIGNSKLEAPMLACNGVGGAPVSTGRFRMAVGPES